ncbi:MAG: type I-U CRISPR-associated protein Cas7 [Phycisphaerae bacterium]|nr:MAG: type I-U CRISPR-associated protein Cas7 [Phycisphaerae bacterium]MBE7458286.1 type I-U CRISPR-associated protein Cas7 [Planctomycetia bacterium]MCL4720261.1 type I-U CRISPR-associated protein Cas7 [Phycisphaerae bacterium]
MPDSLTLETLRNAVAGSAAAFRCVTEYQPAGGPGDKVFPPTYEGGKYATEKRYVPDPQNPGDPSKARVADCVLLDSVQSQANRMELALLDAWEAERIELPVIVVDFNNHRLEKRIRVTSLDAPHRIADAILRDSYDGNGKGRELFRQSKRGKRLDAVDLRNATPLLEMCPTALVFGMWDSTGPKGGLGAKFQRALVSEIVGYDAVPGVKTSSRIDPLGIQKDEQTTIFASRSLLGWTLERTSARTDGRRNEPVKLGDGKPSEINHGNVTPSIVDGGFTISRAVQTTTLSLPALRRLHFPTDAGGRPASDAERKKQEDINVAARTALAALGLCAATLAREAGCDLRSRCQLVATTPFEWEFLDKPGESEHARFSLSTEQAIKLLMDAVAGLRKHIPGAWPNVPIALSPSDELIELVVRSQKLAAAGRGDAGESGE